MFCCEKNYNYRIIILHYIYIIFFFTSHDLLEMTPVLNSLLNFLTFSRSTSSASFIFLVWICSISSLPVESGIPMSISRSNLPKEGHQWKMCACVYACVWVAVSVLTKTSQSSIHAVWSVCCCHDNHMSPLLQAIHQGQELGHDTPLHFTMGLHTQQKLKVIGITQIFFCLHSEKINMHNKLSTCV